MRLTSSEYSQITAPFGNQIDGWSTYVNHLDEIVRISCSLQILVILMIGKTLEPKYLHHSFIQALKIDFPLLHPPLLLQILSVCARFSFISFLSIVCIAYHSSGRRVARACLFERAREALIR
jgi:hypothetical protein